MNGCEQNLASDHVTREQLIEAKYRGLRARNLLLRKVFNRHILKTRPPNFFFFAQVGSIEDSCKMFKSRPYLSSHVTRIEKTLKNLKAIQTRNLINRCQQIKNFKLLNATYGFCETRIIIKVVTRLLFYFPTKMLHLYLMLYFFH